MFELYIFSSLVFEHTPGYSLAEELVPRFVGHLVHMGVNLDYICQQVLKKLESEWVQMVLLVQVT